MTAILLVTLMTAASPYQSRTAQADSFSNMNLDFSSATGLILQDSTKQEVKSGALQLGTDATYGGVAAPNAIVSTNSEYSTVWDGLSVPANGAITAWRVNTYTPVQPIRLKAYHKNSTNNYTLRGDSSLQTVTATSINGPFSTNIPVLSGDVIGIDSNDNPYKNSGGVSAFFGWNGGNFTGTGAFANSNTGYTLPNVEFTLTTFSTSQAYYATTSDTTHVPTKHWTAVGSIALTQSTPTNTSLKYFVSFDGRASWKYWNGSSWSTAAGGVSDLETTGMSKATLEGLSSADWSASGGFVVGTTQSIDLGMSFKTTVDTATPSIDQVTFNYTASADNSWDFATASESGYTQQDATNGTDFVSDTARLHATSQSNTYSVSGGSGGTGGQFSYTAPDGTTAVSSSPTYTSAGNYYMQYMFDGSALSGTPSPNQYWLTNDSSGCTSAAPCTLTFTFPSLTTLDHVVVYPYSRSDTWAEYTIAVSQDGSTWTFIAGNGNTSTGVATTGNYTHTSLGSVGDNFSYASAGTYKYVKFSLFRQTGFGATLNEVQFYRPTTIYPYNTGYYVTSNTNQLNTTSWTVLGGTDFSETLPTNTSIKYLVSFDGRATWKYWNGTSWTTSTLGNIGTNGVSSATLHALTFDKWQSSGGFVPGTTTTMDFAAQLKSADASVTPTLDQISVEYSTSPAGPTLALSAPNGGNSLNGSEHQNITWSASGNTGSIDHYRILLSTDSGASYPTVVANSVGASPYDWTINDVSTVRGRIMIQAIDSSGNTIGYDASDADFTIHPSPSVAFLATSSNGGEGATTVNIPVTLDATSTQTVTVDYAVTGGTATGGGTDFTLASGTASITAGATSTNITMTVNNDTLYEGNETVIVTLSNPSNAKLGTNTTHTYTINDNDPAPTIQFHATTASGSEATTSVNLQVDLSTASGANSTVDYAVTGGTAAGGGVDYTLASGTATITAGATNTNIVLTVVNDALHENNETVIVTLSNPTNSTLGSNTSETYTINDNDAAPTIQFHSTTGSGSEGSSPVIIQIDTSVVSGLDATVDYAVTGGTATGGGVDYTLASGTATITAGATSTSITMTVVDDAFYEGNETVVVTLSNPTGSTLGANTTHTQTIAENETAPTIAFHSSNSSGSEATSPVSIQIDLSAVSAIDATVHYAVIGGDATGGGVDYTLASGIATISAGATNTSITMTVVDDSLYEANEYVQIELSSPTNSTLGGLTTTLYFIDDNDPQPTIQFHVTSAHADEAYGLVNIQIDLSAVSGLEANVHYAVTGGTATGGGVDYTLGSGTATILAGATNTNVTMTVVDDALPESDETVIVTLSNATTTTLGANTVFTYTINDNDSSGTADLSLTNVVNDAAPFVGDTVIYTVTVSNGGPATATNVAVKDLLPADISYVSSAPSQGSYVSGTGIWTVGTLSNGADATLSIHAHVDLAAMGTTATDTAEITASNQVDPDSTPDNHVASEDDQASVAITVSSGTNDPTLVNSVTMERQKAGASGTIDFQFDLQNTLTGTLTITFPSAFHINSAATAGNCSGGGTLDTFGFSDAAHTLTAEKHSCAGTVTLTGANVTNPVAPGSYYISWVNDDPGGATVVITGDDQISVTATVNPYITFQVVASTTACTHGTDGSSNDHAPAGDGGIVALGALTSVAVGSSDALGVNHICTFVTTNASAGYGLTVKSRYGQLQSGSAPTDAIPMAPQSNGTVTAVGGTAAYSMCLSTSDLPNSDNTDPGGTDLSPAGPFGPGTCAGTNASSSAAKLTTSTQPIGSNTSGVQDGTATWLIKASINATTPIHNDYQDTLTFIATGTF